MDRLWTDDVDVPERADYWVGKVGSIRRFVSRDKDARAPYKPLLLLWLIGRLAGGRPTRVSFSEAELDLKLLMHRYRLGRSVRVGFPFVYLATSRELVEGGGTPTATTWPRCLTNQKTAR